MRCTGTTYCVSGIAVPIRAVAMILPARLVQ